MQLPFEQFTIYLAVEHIDIRSIRVEFFTICSNYMMKPVKKIPRACAEAPILVLQDINQLDGSAYKRFRERKDAFLQHVVHREITPHYAMGFVDLNVLYKTLSREA